MRVIAGRLGGRRLLPPPRGVRPTADRVREALFARLPDLEGARVLDLYAGTGALGIEALSRGARRAVFVERSHASLQVLRRNLQALALEDVSRVVRGDVASVLPRLAREQERFELVLADPPYDADLAAPLAALVSAGLLSAPALVVVERSRRHPLARVEGLDRRDARRYGDTVLEFMTWPGALPEEPPGGASAASPRTASPRDGEPEAAPAEDSGGREAT